MKLFPAKVALVVALFSNVVIAREEKN